MLPIGHIQVLQMEMCILHFSWSIWMTSSFHSKWMQCMK